MLLLMLPLVVVSLVVVWLVVVVLHRRCQGASF
jgi:hypothetical protein